MGPVKELGTFTFEGPFIEAAATPRLVGTVHLVSNYQCAVNRIAARNNFSEMLRIGETQRQTGIAFEAGIYVGVTIRRGKCRPSANANDKHERQ